MTDDARKLNTFNHWAFAVVICLLLSGCSGGISGTGDGEVIIIVDGTIVENSADTGLGSTANGDNLSIPATQVRQLVPEKLIITVNPSLTNGYTDNERFTTQPLIHRISAHLNPVIEQTNAIQLDINQIQYQLTDSLNQCENAANPCRILATDITTTVSQNTLELAQTQQATTQSTTPAMVGDQTYFTNIEYSNQLPGYFDERLAYSRGDGTNVVLHWTHDFQLVSLLTDGGTETVYTLTDHRKSETTLRRADKSITTIIHAVLLNDSESNSLIEADLNGSEQHYVRAKAKSNSVILYSTHPTDATAAKYREAFTLPDNSYSIDTCTSVNNVCENWIVQTSDAGDSTTLFTAAENTIGDFTTTISSDTRPVIPAGVDEFVIGESVAQQPKPLSLACAGQRVMDNIRTFCWQPLPLEISATLFEETLTSGGSIYRKLSAP